jgi:hypothetical protein
VLVVGGVGAAGLPLRSGEIFAEESDGTPCSGSADCESGHCVDGVCCDTACDLGICDACSIAAGAQKPGVCTILTGNPCDDGDACTDLDACQAGACVGSQVDCGLYACVDAGECLNRCDSVTDCATDKVCNPSNECIDRPDSQGIVDETGCTLGTSRPSESHSSSAAVVFLLGFATLMMRRRA